MVPKFRAWDKLTDTIQDVLDIKFIEKTVTVSQKDIVWYKHDNLRPFEGVILMQSTGLRDKNGVEIFEGDVVSLTEGECSYSGIVVRDYYEFYIKGIGPRDCFDFQDVSNTFDGTTSLEVTTNIYKNPELLEQANEI